MAIETTFEVRNSVYIYIYVDSTGWKPGNMRYSNYHDHLCLVGGWPTPWKIWKSDWIIIPTIGENKKCSKPPTRNRPWDDKFLCFFLHIYLVGGAIAILKNDGVRQWEGLSHIWNGQIKAMFETTNQIYLHIYFYRSVYSWSTTDSNKTDYGGYWSYIISTEKWNYKTSQTMGHYLTFICWGTLSIYI